MENKMMYLVTEWNGLQYDDFEEKVIGVFDTKEKAEKVKLIMEQNINKKTDYGVFNYTYYIEEYELNTYELDLEKYKID